MAGLGAREQCQKSLQLRCLTPTRQPTPRSRVSDIVRTASAGPGSGYVPTTHLFDRILTEGPLS